MFHAAESNCSKSMLFCAAFFSSVAILVMSARRSVKWSGTVTLATLSQSTVLHGIEPLTIVFGAWHLEPWSIISHCTFETLGYINLCINSQYPHSKFLRHCDCSHLSLDVNKSGIFVEAGNKMMWCWFSGLSMSTSNGGMFNARKIHGQWEEMTGKDGWLLHRNSASLERNPGELYRVSRTLEVHQATHFTFNLAWCQKAVVEACKFMWQWREFEYCFEPPWFEPAIFQIFTIKCNRWGNQREKTRKIRFPIAKSRA